MFETTVLFKEIAQIGKKYIICQGGTSSGKTYAILQYLYYLAHKDKCVITVVSQSIPHLKSGAYRDAQTIYNSSPWLQQHIRTWNKSERMIHFKNGSVIEFKSYADSENAKSGKRDYCFINEADSVDFMIYQQLAMRTSRQVFVDYNPSTKFWAMDLANNDNAELLITDHRHNTFLLDAQHTEIENLINIDTELHRVYARGLTGKLTNQIYANWQSVPDYVFPWDNIKNAFIGLDWGQNDPVAIILGIRQNNVLFCHQLAYTPALSVPEVAAIIRGVAGDLPIMTYGDINPMLNPELRRLGVMVTNAYKNSIIAGIKKLKEIKVYYTESSLAIAKEVKKYVWQTDKKTGQLTEKPVDKDDHCMDAIRYGYYGHYFRGRE